MRNGRILPRLFWDRLRVILFSSEGGNASGPENDLIRLGDVIGEMPGDAVLGVDEDEAETVCEEINIQ